MRYNCLKFVVTYLCPEENDIYQEGSIIVVRDKQRKMYIYSYQQLRIYIKIFCLADQVLKLQIILFLVWDSDTWAPHKITNSMNSIFLNTIIFLNPIIPSGYRYLWLSTGSFSFIFLKYCFWERIVSLLFSPQIWIPTWFSFRL